ncbi:MAG: hypothetical protein RMN24_00750 [Anaerolineae bacterium]|nr:hypothetical protein [Caldilineales bacterium]MDW8267668.1 hypothetical protein [Anaerolineae bacterium]
MRRPIIRPGPITRGLGNRRGRDEARYRAAEVLRALREARRGPRAMSGPDWEWTEGDLQIAVHNLRLERDMLCCDVFVTVDGETVPLDNPVCIYSPPVLVPVGPMFIWQDEEGVEHVGYDCEEDPIVAFQQTLRSVIYAHLRRLYPGREFNA